MLLSGILWTTLSTMQTGESLQIIASPTRGIKTASVTTQFGTVLLMPSGANMWSVILCFMRFPIS